MDKEKIINEILNSKKYKNLCREVIEEIFDKEKDKYKSEKLLIKRIKSKIHQVYSIFLTDREYERISYYLSLLKEKEDFKKILKEILKIHISTRERLDFYEELYIEIFKVTGKPSSILDLACGFNPFSIPWMNLEKPVEYYAYDIDIELIKLINRFFAILSYPQLARVQNIVNNIPSQKAHLAFLFKFIPTLEQYRKGYTKKFLNSINANFIVVSFPLKSISGREKGMERHYKDMFYKNLPEKLIEVSSFFIPREMFFILKNEGMYLHIS